MFDLHHLNSMQDDSAKTAVPAGSPAAAVHRSQQPHAVARLPWATLVFIVGVLWSIYFLGYTGFLYVTARQEEPDIARHLVMGHGFLSPLDLSAAAPPSSWSPPVYPLIAAAVYRVFGLNAPHASVVLGAIQALCYGAVAAGLLVLGRRLFHPVAGLLAAAVFLAHPIFLGATAWIWDHYVALAIFVWLLVAATAIRQSRPTFWRMAVLGAGLGLLSLTNASYVLTIPAIVLLAVSSVRWPQATRLVLPAVAAFILVLAPWTVRNYLRFHEIFYVRRGAYMELWFGNLPGQTGWITWFNGHPGQDANERRMLLTMGEPRYFDYCKDRFWRDYRQDPVAFWKRTAARACYVVLGDPSDRDYFPFVGNRVWHGMVIRRVLLNAIIATLGLAGAWTAWRLRYLGAWILAIGLLSVAPFVLAGAWYRHYLPLQMTLVLLSGFLLWALWERFRTGTWPQPVVSACPAPPATPPNPPEARIS